MSDPRENFTIKYTIKNGKLAPYEPSKTLDKTDAGGSLIKTGALDMASKDYGMKKEDKKKPKLSKKPKPAKKSK